MGLPTRAVGGNADRGWDEVMVVVMVVVVVVVVVVVMSE